MSFKPLFASIVGMSVAALFCVSASSRNLVAQGSIIGRITVEDTNRPAIGASVQLVGTKRGALTDSLGDFRIIDVPAGWHALEARAHGYSTTRLSVLVRDGASAHAALSLSSAPRDLAGVTVIGGRPDALARIPGAASAVGPRQLELMQPLSAGDALRTIAGVHIQEEEGAGLRANIGIRGLDPDRSRSVLVLEDGVPVALAPYGEPELYYSPPIDRMARIEVIKGSGSILFGPQTIGGVVNYVTAEPTAGLHGRAQLSGGGAGARLAKAQLGFARSAAGGIITGFERRATDLNGLSYAIRDVTGKAGVRTATGAWSAKVSLYDEGSNATYLGLTDSLYRAAPYAHPSPGDQLAVRRQAANVSHDLEFGSLASLRTTVYGYHTSRDWTRRDYTYGPTGSTILFANSTGARNRSFDVGGIEPRLRILWMLGSVASDLDVGVRYHRERARDRYVLGTAAGTPTGVRDDERRTGEAMAAWVQNRFALHPTLQLTPGVRVERFRFARAILRTRVRRSDTTGTVRAPEDVDLRSGDAISEVIPGFGATWTPAARTTVFAGAHRGFAPPRTKDALIYSDPTLPVGAQVPDPVSLQLDAERSWNFELGTRLAPRPYLTMEATAFLLDFTNQIIAPSLSSGSVAAAAFANQGATRHEGVEVGGALDLGRWLGRRFALAVEGNYTYARAVFSRDRLLRQGLDTVNVRGNALPYAPRHRSHLALTFERSDWRARLDGTFVGAQFSDNFETLAGSANGRVGEIPAYRVYDASVQYDLRRLPGVRVVGSVKNLAGRSYIASRRPEGIKAGLPRLVTAGLSWTF